MKYDSPLNSLLPYVLAFRRGIPISIAVLHAAVANRAGVQVQPVGMPLHFVNKLGVEGSPSERFIDVFDGGKLRRRWVPALRCWCHAPTCGLFRTCDGCYNILDFLH